MVKTKNTHIISHSVVLKTNEAVEALQSNMYSFSFKQKQKSIPCLYSNKDSNLPTSKKKIERKGKQQYRGRS